MADTRDSPTIRRPDLSHLLETEEERALCRRIVVAEIVFGWAWSGDNRRWFSGAVAGYWLYELRPGARARLVGLPDPERDPAAAWELETRELIGWETTGVEHRFRFEGEWRARGITLEGWRYGPWRSDRKRAAVRAVLHKYADDPAWSDLIRPLLDAESVRG